MGEIMEKFEIEVVRTNSQIIFANYEAVRKWISDGVAEFESKEYKSLDETVKDRETLEIVKSKLKLVQEELRSPYAKADKQLEDLLKLVQKPLSAINKFEKELKQSAKKQQILSFAEGMLRNMGDYSNKIISSKAFFDEEWLKATYTDKKWKDAVSKKITSIVKDITSILRTDSERKVDLLAVYYETLSMDSIKNFMNNISSEISSIKEIEDEDKIVGYKVIKVYGTSSQMSQIFDQLELMEINFEEIEDGMPKNQEELLEPLFDSFVAFDIEHSGTYGAAYGDGPAEITEIGAIKVLNGKIVDQIDLLMNPGRKITKRNEQLTGITNEMVKDEPPVSVRIKEFKDFVGDMVLVGHNIKTVDLPFINLAGKKNGISFENSFFDTYFYAKKYKESENWENVKLEYLAGHFGINDPGHHRADNDARVNVEVYFKLKDLNNNR